MDSSLLKESTRFWKADAVKQAPSLLGHSPPLLAVHSGEDADAEDEKAVVTS